MIKLSKLIIPSMLILFFLITNVIILNNKDFGKDKNISILDKIYYTFISFTTVGFGDFYPVTIKAKVLSIIQNILIIFIPLIFCYKNYSFSLYHKNNLFLIYGHIIILFIAFLFHMKLYKKHNIDFISKLYHTFIVHTTIGYGDISPSTTYGKLVNVIHSILVYILISIS